MSAPASEVDVVVIGGGLSGTAVLRDLARRGASVVLIEKGDLAARGSLAGQGTIDTSGLGIESGEDARAAEAAILKLTAPHLASDVPVLAIDAGARRGPSLLAHWDAMLALRARSGERVDRVPLDAAAAMAREPALEIEPDRGALLGKRVRIDAHRLAIAFVRDATEQGADIHTHEAAISVQAEGDRAHVVTTARVLHARAVVIATGADPTPGGGPRERTRTLHLVLDHAFTTHAIVVDAGSLVPFHNVSVVSGRSDREEGAVTRDEVRALLGTLARTIPELREARVDAAYASLRRATEERAAPPIWHVPLGTPWDARARAERLATRIATTLGLKVTSDTATSKVPGGESIEDSFVVSDRLAVPEPTARRILLRHGVRVLDIGARLGKRRTEASVVCACEPVLEAEIRHAVRIEHARDVCDVGRRSRLGHGACGGMRCAHRAAEIVVSERALSPRDAHAMTSAFLAERWAARAPALDPVSLAQEELAHARWASSSLAEEGE